MALAVDLSSVAVWNSFTDGDGTKTLATTIANVAGRAAFALAWAGSGTDAGSTATIGGNTMTAMAPGSDGAGFAYRAYHLSGDGNIPTGSQNFILTCSSQIVIRILFFVVNGLDPTTQIIGTPIYFTGTTSTPSVGGHATWTGDMALGFGMGGTANFNTITGGASTTLDFGGTPASPQAICGHRTGGNVAVNFGSDHSDEFVLVGVSLNEPGAGATILNMASYFRRLMEG